MFGYNLFNSTLVIMLSIKITNWWANILSLALFLESTITTTLIKAIEECDCEGTLLVVLPKDL